jgi:transposase
VRLGKTDPGAIAERDSLLVERVERLRTIPAFGLITALTWTLEVGGVPRFSSIKKATGYCGLCGAENTSANIIKRTPLSKQRNKHLQTILIEAAKMAPRKQPRTGNGIRTGETKRQCQPPNACRGAEDGGVSGRC